jgi:hypothetical protein
MSRLAEINLSFLIANSYFHDLRLLAIPFIYYDFPLSWK